MSRRSKSKDKTENTNRINARFVWSVIKGLVEAARPGMWLKPLFLMLVASTYARGDLPNLPRLLLGFLIVGPLLWGGLYMLNAITDKEDDSQHPIKRFRPFPSGRVNVDLGKWVSGLMICLALLLGWQFGILFTCCLVLMVIKQLAYTLPNLRLKEKFLWDIVSGSLGNSTLRFSAGWFLYSSSFKMPILLLVFAECLQLAGFLVNRLFTNYATGVEQSLHYTSTTTRISANKIKGIIAMCWGIGIISFILLSLNGKYHFLAFFWGELPIQSLIIILLLLLFLPFFSKAMQRADKFSYRESQFYYDIPLLIVFVLSIFLSLIISHYR
jgi:4-hydroxybenzoate polyprenyltransferase